MMSEVYKCCLKLASPLEYSSSFGELMKRFGDLCKVLDESLVCGSL